MRWIWIDRILELEAGRRCVAVKNISLAEEVLHDHFAAEDGFAAWPIMPNTLIIEGMAQTAGILVGKTGNFSRNVVLAKISRASFEAVATAGHCLRFTASLDRFDDVGAATSGVAELLEPGCSEGRRLGQIDLLFSHVAGASAVGLPAHNFVFSGPLVELLNLGTPR